MIRFLFYLIFTFNYLCGYSQDKFVLNGAIQGKDTGSIILNYQNLENTFVFDTAKLINGNFSFFGKINQPTFSWLSSNGTGNRTSLFLEAKNQKILLKENHFQEMKMIGSFSQEQSDSLSQVTKEIESKYTDYINLQNELHAELRKTKDSANKIIIENNLTSTELMLDSMMDEKLDSTLSFIKFHPGSYVSTTELYGLIFTNRIPLETANIIFNTFSTALKKSSVGKLIQSELEKRKVDFPINDFTTLDVNGKKLSSDQFRGKYLLLNFWASWCIPCIEKIPELKQLLNLYQKKGFEIINISVDTDKIKWKKAILKYKLACFHNIITNADIDSKYSNTKEPIPSEVLFSTNGKVLWNSKNKNGLTLRVFLEECIK